MGLGTGDGVTRTTRYGCPTRASCSSDQRRAKKHPENVEQRVIHCLDLAAQMGVASERIRSVPRVASSVSESARAKVRVHFSVVNLVHRMLDGRVRAFASIQPQTTHPSLAHLFAHDIVDFTVAFVLHIK